MREIFSPTKSGKYKRTKELRARTAVAMKGNDHTVTHGHHRGGRGSPTYESWNSMRTRCSYPNNNRFKDYGGRGIKVCDRWKLFRNFLTDMGERPSGKTLDRINNDGNYEPSNCRWATPKEQTANRRKRVPVLPQITKEEQRQ